MYDYKLVFTYRCFAYMYACTLYACLVPREPEEGIRSHELESQMVMGCPVDSGNQTQSSGIVVSVLNP